MPKIKIICDKTSAKETIRSIGVDGTRDLRAVRTPLVNLDPILTHESLAFLLLFYVLETIYIFFGQIYE